MPSGLLERILLERTKPLCPRGSKWLWLTHVGLMTGRQAASLSSPLLLTPLTPPPLPRPTTALPRQLRRILLRLRVSGFTPSARGALSGKARTLGAQTEAGNLCQEDSSLSSQISTWALNFAPPDSALVAESKHIQDEVETLVNDQFSLSTEKLKKLLSRRIPTITTPASCPLKLSHLPLENRTP